MLSGFRPGGEPYVRLRSMSLGRYAVLSFSCGMLILFALPLCVLEKRRLLTKGDRHSRSKTIRAMSQYNSVCFAQTAALQLRGCAAAAACGCCAAAALLLLLRCSLLLLAAVLLLSAAVLLRCTMLMFGTPCSCLMLRCR